MAFGAVRQAFSWLWQVLVTVAEALEVLLPLAGVDAGVEEAVVNGLKPRQPA